MTGEPAAVCPPGEAADCELLSTSAASGGMGSGNVFSISCAEAASPPGGAADSAPGLSTAAGVGGGPLETLDSELTARSAQTPKSSLPPYAGDGIINNTSFAQDVDGPRFSQARKKGPLPHALLRLHQMLMSTFSGRPGSELGLAPVLDCGFRPTNNWYH
jgi:hypothetical protein